ncbi:MAG: hypothetical protein AAFV53_22500 [Myxococcota bacterium]
MPSASLTARQESQIRELYTRSIQRGAASFRRAFDDTDEFCLGMTPSGALGAVVGLSYIRQQVDGREHIIILSGTVALDKAYRGRGINNLIGLRAWARCRMASPGAALFWGFTSSTVGAYLFMQRSCAEHWPRHDAPTPAPIKHLMDCMGAQIGGYDRRAGLVMYNTRPLEALDGPSAARHPDPAVRFYAGRNPQSAAGGALLCLCPLTTANAVSITRHMLSRYLRRNRTRRDS